jgi:methyl-accepting chemotaxis protein
VSLRERYVATLYWSVSALGVDESVERTVLAAVTIQFAVSLAQAGAPFLLPDGPVRLAAQATLLAGATVAFGNTAIIARRNVIAPVERLRTVAAAVAAGRVPETAVGDHPDVDPTQPDEIGDLARAVEEMRASLATVERQAEALADRSFDDPAFDREVPGEFGEALSGMRAELRRYTRELETVIQRFGETADAARDGDLTARVDPERVPAGYEALARDFDDLLDALAASLADAEEFAASVATATDDVGDRADELRATDETAADAVAEIAEAAERQRRELSTAADEVSDLSATVEEVAASATDVRERTAEADDLAREGRAEAASAVEDLEAVADRTAETAETVAALVEAVEEVDEIASVIEELADRTNLLAVNAAVEAARADGDGAAGFAVVAEEVQELSEAGGERAGEIRETAETLGARADAAATAVTETRREVTRTVDRVETALGRFDDLADAVAEIDEGVAEVSTATDEQARVASDLAGHVESVAALAADTAADTETVAATADQGASVADAVAADAAALSRDADRLSAAFDRFTLPASTDEDDPTVTPSQTPRN